MKNVSRILAIWMILSGVTLVASSAQGAEFTDVLDAADDKDDYDEETYDPFDFNLEPSFTFETGKAEITREAPCVPSAEYTRNHPDNPRTQVGTGRCDEVSIVDNKEMTYRHQEARLDVDLRAGMYKDLELRINVPVVFQSTHGLKFADEVDSSNSAVDPSNSRINENAQNTFQGASGSDALGSLNRFQMHRFFDLSDGYQNYDRAGLADPSIGIHWAPYNNERDDTKATLTLGMDYTLPIAKIKQADNDAVGEGLHKLNWSFGSSKRLGLVDPYFGLDYTLQIPARGSPIKDLKEIDANNSGQTVTQPPQKGNITIGTEFVPKENEEKGSRYAIDLRFNFGYVSEGRNYTPLYDHMVNSQCNGKSFNDILQTNDPDNISCSWIAQRPANVENSDPVYDLGNLSNDDTFQTNGIMTVEGHAVFSGHLGFYIQPSRYFQLKAIAGLEHRQEHFLTNARTGNDVADSQEVDGDDKVDLTGEDAKKERNPAYNATYDSPGNRFRVSEYNTWTFLLTAAFQF